MLGEFALHRFPKIRRNFPAERSGHPAVAQQYSCVSILGVGDGVGRNQKAFGFETLPTAARIARRWAGSRLRSCPGGVESILRSPRMLGPGAASQPLLNFRMAAEGPLHSRVWLGRLIPIGERADGILSEGLPPTALFGACPSGAPSIGEQSWHVSWSSSVPRVPFPVDLEPSIAVPGCRYRESDFRFAVA